ncbi:MAG TPA: FAD-dependent monooxygenase [Luteibacter sp.]|uniref:FAD-dependent oxidoreductase n=1 Tax=Luteibacter sp. TaxID=1886636 RepID=UPI002BD3A0C6|nr:FAD-dependent monooxygenase [Luteibacter sp.]HVI53545.1 FAD-dependent monooxygenase [Luteibacter sp.]
MSQPSVLIAGAGPTGLAAALLLDMRGVKVRIVDSALRPAAHSRALVVNPRTLDLLAGTGVTERMLAEGRPVRGVRFHENAEVLATIEATSVHPRYGLTVLSQARSEALLTEALDARGIHIERGVRAGCVGQDDDEVRVALNGASDGEQGYAAVFAADGARSDFRKTLEIGFSGSSYPEPWPLYDVPLQTTLDRDHAHLMFFPEGMIFLLALDDEVWRIISNMPDPLSRLPGGTVSSEPIWESSFHIAHRVADRCAIGRIALGGDAAHVHSPVGARGMNLGIEDAAAFAMLFTAPGAQPMDALQRYHRERHAVHKGVVRRVHAITALARSGNPWVARLRHVAIPWASHMPALSGRILRTVAGLDHPTPTP